MTAFRMAQAAGADWRKLAQACLDQLGDAPASLGFLYASDLVSDDLPALLDALRERSAVAHWVGTVGMGVCATGREYSDEPAVVAMAADLPSEHFRVFGAVRGVDDLAALGTRCAGGPANFAIVHGDPRNADIGELVAGLAAKVESGFVVGGLTSSRRLNSQIADGITEGGVSGVMLTGDVVVATRLTQGCSPVGPKRVITECQRNIVVSIDNRPAVEVMLEDVGERVGRDLAHIGGQVFVGMPVRGTDTGDYLVRNLVGIDPQSRILAIGDIVEPGQSLMFCRRDEDSAREDMARMLLSIKQGLFGRPRAGLYHSCLARGRNLFGSESEELRMIRDALGDFPLVGFFGNGEISHNRLYGYTGVLTLFV